MATSSIKYLGELRSLSEHERSGVQLVTDAPPDNQGKGESFSPTDLVATALGNCAMTIMGIAAQKHTVPFRNIEASVTKIMADSPRRISRIVVEFTIGEEWDEKQRRLMETAAKTCPVSRSLSPELEQEFIFNYRGQ